MFWIYQMTFQLFNVSTYLRNIKKKKEVKYLDALLGMAKVVKQSFMATNLLLEVKEEIFLSRKNCR